MVHHHYLNLKHPIRDAYLAYLCHEALKFSKTTAIFTRSVSETRRVSRLLDTLNIGAISLQLDLSPSERAALLDKVRRRECHVIVTTDGAAALDRIPVVDRIINFSLMWRIDLETYTQRISNLCPGCNSGLAITLVTPYDVEAYHCLERVLGVRMAEYAVDMDMVMSYWWQMEVIVLVDLLLPETKLKSAENKRAKD